MKQMTVEEVVAQLLTLPQKALCEVGEAYGSVSDLVEIELFGNDPGIVMFISSRADETPDSPRESD